MDDQRNDRNHGHDRDQNRDRGNYNHNRNRHHRMDRHGGRHGGGGGGGHMNRGRPQRPLLTSAINAAGLSLIALILLFQMKEMAGANVKYMGWAVVLFGLSSFISYIAQRVRPAIIEKLSDVLFLAGIVLVIWVAGTLSGLWMM